MYVEENVVVTSQPGYHKSLEPEEVSYGWKNQ